LPRRLAALALLLLLTACATTPAVQVEPGDGPASPVASEPAEATPNEGPAGEPTKYATEPEPEVASFKDKYVYPDGVEVEVTKIQHGEVSQEDIDNYGQDTYKLGSPWVHMTVRVRNGSDQRLQDVSSSYSVTIGEDGDEADVYPFASDVDSDDMTGSILPGKSKVSSSTFLIPTKLQEDVVLEYSFSYDREAAIFLGSVEG
jgi:hypothetical protein